MAVTVRLVFLRYREDRIAQGGDLPLVLKIIEKQVGKVKTGESSVVPRPRPLSSRDPRLVDLQTTLVVDGRVVE